MVRHVGEEHSLRTLAGSFARKSVPAQFWLDLHTVMYDRYRGRAIGKNENSPVSSITDGNSF